MAKSKKTFLWLAGSIATVLALIAGLLFVLPLYLNSPAAKKKVQTVLSRELGSTITFERLDLSLLPLPHVTIERPGLSIPEEAGVSLKSLSIYPQVVPLIKGKVIVSRIEMQEPDFKIVLREKAMQADSAALGGIRAGIRNVLASLNANAPGLAVQIHKGTLALYQREHRLISLQNIDARFGALPEGMEMAMRAKSASWGDVALNGTWSFDEDAAGVQGLSGTLGHSSLSGLNARLTWNRPAGLEILSGTALIRLDELRRWLLAIDYPVPYLKDFTNLTGTVELTSLIAKGPIARFIGWQWKIAGLAQSVAVESSLLPAPLALSGSFSSEQNSIELANASVSLGRSIVSRVFARLEWRKEPRIRISSGRAVLALDELSAWRSRSNGLSDALKEIQALSGLVRLSAISLDGPLLRPDAWKASLAGAVENLELAARLLPGPAAVSRGTFSWTPSRLVLTDVHTSLQDASFTVSGALTGSPKDIKSADLVMDGSAGPESVQWVFTTLALPQKFLVNAPLTFAGVHVAWQRDSGASVVGKASAAGDVSVDFDLHQVPGALVIRKATIKDRGSDAGLSLHYRRPVAEISFQGTLAQTTLNKLFARLPPGNGTIQGDLRASIQLDQWEGSTAEGNLKGTKIIIPWGSAAPGEVDGFSLRAAEHITTVDSADLTWGGHRYSMSGTVRAAGKGFMLDMDLAADVIDVKMIRQALERRNEEREEQKTPSFAKPLVLGTMRVRSPSLLYDKYTFSPVRAVVTFEPDNVRMVFSEANTCSLSIPGTLVFSHAGISLDLRPAAAGQNLEAAVKCLLGEEVRISGAFDLSAEFRAAGKGGTLLPALEGTVSLSAKEGKIYRYPLLAKIFSILSVTEIFRGKTPELGGSGFSYRSLIVKGELHQGKLLLDRAFIDGSSIDLIAEGEVDFANRRIDLVMLVAPFSTINWIVRHIPLVGKVMGGTLISIPVKVSGDLADPEVTFLAPSAVGMRLVELMKNILELPVAIISPVLPREKEDRK
jgi:AsmA-like protein